MVVARGFTINANGSFNDVKYKEYKNAPCPPERAGSFCDLSGRAALVNAPRWIANLGAQYATALAANVEAYGNVNYAYRSSTYGTLDASEYARIPGYSLSNLETVAVTAEDYADVVFDNESRSDEIGRAHV